VPLLLFTLSSPLLIGKGNAAGECSVIYDNITDTLTFTNNTSTDIDSIAMVSTGTSNSVTEANAGKPTGWWVDSFDGINKGGYMIQTYPTPMSTSTNVLFTNVLNTWSTENQIVTVYAGHYVSGALWDTNTYNCGTFELNAVIPETFAPVRLSDIQVQEIAVAVAAEVTPVHIDDNQITQYVGFGIVCFIGWQFIKMMRVRKHDKS